VEGPLIENGRVTGIIVDGSPRRASLVVAADGVHSLFRRKLGLIEKHGTRRVGASAHFRLETDGFVEVHWRDRHEIYVTPLPRGQALIAILGDRWDTTAANDLTTERISPWRGAARWDVTVPVRHGPGFVLLGDAAGYIDPITGGGLTQALLSAELLAGNWRDLDEFDRSRERMLADYRRITRFALWTSARPAAARVCFDFLRLAPWTFHHLVAVAGGERRLW
jgi:flavin-dependent dehydrogenase